MLQNSWNTSFKIMFDLPFATHRYFVEPVSEKTHLRNILLKRFLGFLIQIEKSPKILPRKLLQVVKYDASSTTGSNLRNILLLTDKYRVDEVTTQDIDNLVYAEAKPEDEWRVSLVQEIIDVKAGQSNIENLSVEKLQASYFLKFPRCSPLLQKPSYPNHVKITIILQGLRVAQAAATERWP